MIEPHKHTFAMGCLFIALLLIGMYYIASPAHSQEAAQPCPPAVAMNQQLEKQFGETVTAGGVLGPQGFMYITLNAKTQTFTILVRKLDGTACVVMAGKGFALADPAGRSGTGL